MGTTKRYIILLLFLAAANVRRVLKVGDLSNEEDRKQNKVPDSFHAGFLVKNSNTSDTSPTCTAKQRSSIARQLILIEDEDIKKTDQEKLNNFVRLKHWFRCPVPTWIENFYAEETNIGSSDFCGISVGCNKGHDAVRTARMGLSDPSIDLEKWREEFHAESISVCSQDSTPTLNRLNPMSPRRKGEMHCVEPMPSTFSELERASENVGFKTKGMVFTQAAISSSTGTAMFPNAEIGTEWLGLKNCNSTDENDKTNCVEVPKFSLEDYVAKYVKGKGPINILQIDVEGYDFDVLFGAGSVLDSTHYIEFEYHETGNWANLRLQDAVRLLDGKGFTCYWAGEKRLWRISGCYFEHYNYFHGWSNVACVHRSQKILYGRMEKIFTDLLEEW